MRLLRLPARIWTIILGSTAALLALGLVARLVVPLTPLEPAPALISVTPQRGTEDVLPRSTITLTFAGPMNRNSVLRALRLDPPTAGQWHWSPDARSLTFTPADALTPAATYTVALSAAALDQWWRPLPDPPVLSFQTAPQPAVLTALPATVATPRESSFAVIFSQPMVAPTALNRDLSVPELHFSPAIPYRARWIAVDTLLIRPITPLPAAQAYVATLDADLVDARGIELGTPYSWRFSTAWPTVSERTPPPGARSVGPRSPLSFTLDAPVDPALLRSTLTISPPIPGDLVVEPRGTAQVVTFTPSRDWTPETTYTVSLTPPAGSNLADPPDLRWRFTIEASPGLAAFFPGQGQLLPTGQAIRLVFTTPMDAETLGAGISFDPPVAALPITVSNTEARITPELAPSTSYTITVAAGTPDSSGTPLANEIVVGLRTPAASPALSAANAAVGLVTLPVSRTASVDLARINLNAVDLSLYALDPPTLRLALAGGPTGLATFDPERYGQPLLRTWRATFSDPPDTLTRSAIPVGLNDDAPLAPGAYLFQATTSEGPRVDLLLIVSDVQLTLRHNANQVLVWATDTNSGAPRAGLPISLYASDLLAARGTTDADGIFELPLRRSPTDALYLALSDAPGLAVARADWSLELPDASAAQPAYLALIWPDQADYTPGDALRVDGRVRRLAAGGELVMPGAMPCRLQLLTPGAPPPPSLSGPVCRITANGRLSATARINPTTTPGDYRIRVSIADTVSELPLRVVTADSFGTTLAVLTHDGAELTLRATSGGLPLVDARVTWDISFSALAPPADAGAADFRFAAPVAEAAPLTGAAVTDTAGRIRIALPTDLDQPLQYRLNATLSAPGGLTAQLSTDGLLAPPDRYQVGLRLPAHFVGANDRAEIELLVRDAAGNPVEGRPIDLAVTRSEATDGPPLLTRRTTSGPDGLVSTQLVPLNPGAYQVSASAGGTPTETTLWVTAPNFSAWGNQPGQVRLIPDRSHYAVGDTARLLITSPWPTATLLLTRERGVLRAADVQTLSAGQVITFTVTPDLAPGFALGAVLTNAAERRVGSATVTVTPTEPPLALSVASDRPNYLPGATATISVTLPATIATADLLVVLEEGTTPDRAPGNGGIAPQAPPPLAVAGHPPIGVGARAPAISYRTGTGGFLVSGDVGAGGPGLATLQIPLPNQPGSWRIAVYALDGIARIARATTLVTVSEPLISALIAPPTLRQGDEADLVLELTNTVAVTRSLQVDLELQGATLTTPAADNQQLLLAPDSDQTLTWRMTPNPAATTITARMRLNDGANTTLERRIPVLPAPLSAPLAAETTRNAGPLELTLPFDPAVTSDLEVALAPSLSAALADIADRIVAIDAASTVDRAAHAIIAARLAGITGNPEAARGREAAGATIAVLLSEQNNDGGWGWWPKTPSDPFVTAFVVEALAINQSLFGTAARPDPRAMAYLERQAAGAEPNLRAYMAYAAMRFGQPLPNTADLLASELEPAGLAYLALALPADEAALAIERLLALPGPPWDASERSPLPDSPVAVTAVGLEALRNRSPGATQIGAAERFLHEAWGIDGWGGSFSAARIAAAFPLTLPTIGGPRRITLNDQALISATTPFTGTTRARVAIDGFRTPLILAVETSGAAPYLLAYRAPVAAAPVRAPAAILTMSYHDPATGALVAPTQLRSGQLVEVRVQTIAMQPITGAQLTLHLPTTLTPLETEAQTPFIHAQIDASQAQVRFFAPHLSAGVSHQSVLVRVAARGSFTAPAPRLEALDGAAVGTTVLVAPDRILIR
jgi:alpha-2-macroglobulin